MGFKERCGRDCLSSPVDRPCTSGAMAQATLATAVADAGAEQIKAVSGAVAKKLGSHIESSWKDAEVPTQALAKAFKQTQSKELEEVVEAAKTCEYLLQYYAMNSIHKDQIKDIKKKI